MKSAKTLLVAALFIVPTFAASVAFTQTHEDSSFQSREQNFREYVTLLRTDVKTQRKGIITQLMQFDDADSAKFWPIFDQYDAELAKIGDGRTELIIDYARNYDSLTDAQADTLMSKAFELEGQRAMLKKKYFDKMKTEIGAMQSAKFFLIENQMQHIVDLQISAELPTVQTESK
jgi:hypothetical protein